VGKLLEKNKAKIKRLSAIQYNKMYFLLILFFISLISIALMIGRKLVLIKKERWKY